MRQKSTNDSYSLPEILNRSFILRAPAKLNLRLKIEERREDGYHLLSMLNAPIELCDTLRLSFLKEKEISLCVKSEIVTPCDFADPKLNLASRAAQIFLDHFDLPLGVQLELQKRIPLGSGLGGGSSDAAVVLLCLWEQLKPLLLNKKPEDEQDTLTSLALELGADVPYFLTGGLCYVSGIGEKVERIYLKDVSKIACLVTIPQVPVSTKDAYKILSQSNSKMQFKKDQDLKKVLTLLKKETKDKPIRSLILSVIDNDFEEVICSHYPEIDNLRSRLIGYTGLKSSLSGSGSAFFSICEEETGEEGTLKKINLDLKEKGFDCVLTSITGLT